MKTTTLSVSVESVTENLLSAHSLDCSILFQALHVEVALVAEDEVAIRLVGHILVLEIDDALECDIG